MDGLVRHARHLIDFLHAHRDRLCRRELYSASGDRSPNSSRDSRPRVPDNRRKSCSGTPTDAGIEWTGNRRDVPPPSSVVPVAGRCGTIGRSLDDYADATGRAGRCGFAGLRYRSRIGSCQCLRSRCVGSHPFHHPDCGISAGFDPFFHSEPPRLNRPNDLASKRFFVVSRVMAK